MNEKNVGRCQVTTHEPDSTRQGQEIDIRLCKRETVRYEKRTTWPARALVMIRWPIGEFMIRHYLMRKIRTIADCSSNPEGREHRRLIASFWPLPQL